MLEVAGEPLQAQVIKGAKGPDGQLISQKHSNLSFETRAYIVRNNDSTTDEITANIIAEIFMHKSMRRDAPTPS